jgi:hypothetical protein
MRNSAYSLLGAALKLLILETMTTACAKRDGCYRKRGLRPGAGDVRHGDLAGATRARQPQSFVRMHFL